MRKGDNVKLTLEIKQINASQTRDRDRDEKHDGINKEGSKMIKKNRSPGNIRRAGIWGIQVSLSSKRSSRFRGLVSDVFETRIDRCSPFLFWRLTLTLNWPVFTVFKLTSHTQTRRRCFETRGGETRVSTKAGQGSHGGRTRAAAPHVQVALWAGEKAGKGVEKWLQTICASH